MERGWPEHRRGCLPLIQLQSGSPAVCLAQAWSSKLQGRERLAGSQEHPLRPPPFFVAVGGTGRLNPPGLGRQERGSLVGSSPSCVLCPAELPTLQNHLSEGKLLHVTAGHGAEGGGTAKQAKALAPVAP